jgi:hypothetical protein
MSIAWDSLGVNPAVIAENSARVQARVKPTTEPNDEPVALVAFGASLEDTWEQVRGFKVVYTCSGSHRYLIDRGIVPTYHVDSDPRAYKADILGEPHPDVIYLIASNCHPTYFDKLELYGAKVKLWHIFFPSPNDEFLNLVPLRDWVFTGAHTVGPRMVKMAYLMGYRDLHIFGMDACLTNGKTHASEHPNPPRGLQPFKHEGKVYATDKQWTLHATNLLNDLDRLPGITYKFYGEGLQQAMAAAHIRTPRDYIPLAFQVLRENP